MNGVPVTGARSIGSSSGHRVVRVRVGAWPSGLYFARLRAADGRVGFAPFVVRPRWLGVHRVAVVLPTLTWQAYNLRDEDGDGTGDSWYADWKVKTVRLGRPYLSRGVPYNFRRYDLPFLHWLARTGKDVDVLSQSDLESTRSAHVLASAYDLIVFPGHHEYVTLREYDLVEGYRDLGGNLMFLSANNFFWRVEKRGDVVTKTRLWRDLGRPEAALIGVQYLANGKAPRRPWIVRSSRAGSWILAGTGLTRRIEAGPRGCRDRPALAGVTRGARGGRRDPGSLRPGDDRTDDVLRDERRRKGLRSWCLLLHAPRARRHDDVAHSRQPVGATLTPVSVVRIGTSIHEVTRLPAGVLALDVAVVALGSAAEGRTGRSACSPLQAASGAQKLPRTATHGVIDHLLQYPAVNLATRAERNRARRDPRPARGGRGSRALAKPRRRRARGLRHADTTAQGRRPGRVLLPRGARPGAQEGLDLRRRAAEGAHLCERSWPPADPRRSDVEHARRRARADACRADPPLALAHRLQERDEAGPEAAAERDLPTGLAAHPGCERDAARLVHAGPAQRVRHQCSEARAVRGRATAARLLRLIGYPPR